jgi:hypothetical protein
MNRTGSAVILIFALSIVSPCVALAKTGGPSSVPPTGKRQVANTVTADLASVPAFARAQADFNKGQYVSAAAQFEDLDKKGYGTDLLHYYLAMSYQRCNQVSSAQFHYRWVVANSKNQALIDRSADAFNSLTSYEIQRNYAGQGNNFAYAKFPAPPPKGPPDNG